MLPVWLIIAAIVVELLQLLCFLCILCAWGERKYNDGIKRGVARDD